MFGVTGWEVLGFVIGLVLWVVTALILRPLVHWYLKVREILDRLQAVEAAISTSGNPPGPTRPERL